MVISGYNMLNMDGLHLLRNLRGGEKTRGVGFILITGRAEQQIIDHGLRLGMNNFLKKPFQPVDLRRACSASPDRMTSRDCAASLLRLSRD